MMIKSRRLIDFIENRNVCMPMTLHDRADVYTLTARRENLWTMAYDFKYELVGAHTCPDKEDITEFGRDD